MYAGCCIGFIAPCTSLALYHLRIVKAAMEG